MSITRAIKRQAAREVWKKYCKAYNVKRGKGGVTLSMMVEIMERSAKK